MRRRVVGAALVACCASAAAATGYGLLGGAAPDFALRAFAGPNVRLSEGRGDVVVLTFWGSSCGPCRNTLAMLDRSYGTYRTAGLDMYGISVDDDADHARRFAADSRVQFALLSDPEKAVARLYQVDNLPMTILIDRRGGVRYVHRDPGTGDEALYLSQLRELLNE